MNCRWFGQFYFMGKTWFFDLYLTGHFGMYRFLGTYRCKPFCNGLISVSQCMNNRPQVPLIKRPLNWLILLYWNNYKCTLHSDICQMNKDFFSMFSCWVLWCLSKSRLRNRFLWQISHLYWLTVCVCSRICLLRLLGSPNGLRQILQLNGLYPVWVLMWIFKPYLREYNFPQKTHRCIFGNDLIDGVWGDSWIFLGISDFGTSSKRLWWSLSNVSKYILWVFVIWLKR